MQVLEKYLSSSNIEIFGGEILPPQKIATLSGHVCRGFQATSSCRSMPRRSSKAFGYVSDVFLGGKWGQVGGK